MFSLLPSCNRRMILVMITIWFFLVDMGFNSLKLDVSLSHKVKRTSLDLQIIIVLYFKFLYFLYIEDIRVILGIFLHVISTIKKINMRRIILFNVGNILCIIYKINIYSYIPFQI